MPFAASYHGDVICVAGATGRQGRSVVQHLLARGWKVRALTRNPHSLKARKLLQMGACLIEGDMEDKASLRAALKGAHGLFSMQTFEEEGIEAEIRQGKNLAEVAREQDIKHLVYSSVLYAGLPTGIPQWESKAEIEAHIHALGLPVTIFRSATFMDDLLKDEALVQLTKGKIVLPLRPLCIQQFISIEDFGALVAEAFSQPRHYIGEEIELAADQLNMNEVAGVFTKVLQADIRFQSMPLIVARFKLSREAYKSFRWLDKRKLDTYKGADIRQLRQRYPRLLYMEAWLSQLKSKAMTALAPLSRDKERIATFLQ
ncbi:MAG: NmrA/HSCARG family protein [Bacteroidetes bacterium]|nr:MAG: NmrA/HSCARG family protein [Bacteroidota bacterium]